MIIALYKGQRLQDRRRNLGDVAGQARACANRLRIDSRTATASCPNASQFRSALEKPSLNLSASSGISQQIHSDCTVLVRSQTAASGPHFCSSWNKLPAAERLSAVLRVVALWKIDARSWLAKTLCSSLAPQPGPAPRILDWPGTCVRPKAATEHRAYAEMRELQTSDMDKWIYPVTVGIHNSCAWVSFGSLQQMANFAPRLSRT